MNFLETDISGSWIVEQDRHMDGRGWFQEWYKKSLFTRDTCFDFVPLQTNISHSCRGTIRGIHFSLAPDGQAKLITVMNGSIDDYIIDVRVGSPTFGQWQRVRLDASSPRAVLLSPRLGHAFQALENDTVVSYMVTAEFNPSVEQSITPSSPELRIDFDSGLPRIVSDRDLNSPTLTHLLQTNSLPQFESP